jgi:hypothetical protein
VDGTLALAEELERLTGWPPAGAGSVSPTVPLTLLPPITSDRDRVMLPTQADDDDGLMVKIAGIEFADVAVMIAVVEDDTVDVETGTVAVVWPAGMVTDAGTVAAELLLARFTDAPPVAAGCASVTVPVAPCPPDTVLGEMANPLMSAGCAPAGGFTVNVAACEFADVAVMTAVVEDDTVEVETGTVAVVWPAGMVTDAGTLAAELLLARFTDAPPVAAGCASVTVPVAL